MLHSEFPDVAVLHQSLICEGGFDGRECPHLWNRVVGFPLARLVEADVASHSKRSVNIKIEGSTMPK